MPDEIPENRYLKSPRHFSWNDWKETGVRIYQEILRDNVQVVSAGIAFYLFLSIFPALAALVSIYGLVVPMEEIYSQLNTLGTILPAQAYDIVEEIAKSIGGESNKTLGWSLVLSLLISIWSTKKGMLAMFTGLNIAYNQQEDRGLIRANLLQLAFTLGALVFGALSLALVVGIPALVNAMGFVDGVTNLLIWLRWPVLAAIVFFAITMLYKIAPARSAPKFRWVTYGSLISTALWIGASLLFSWYASAFSSFNQSYGSFAAIVVLLFWLFITAFIVLLGAEINSELEHQTAIDTTTGPDKPLGQRNAFHADHIAMKDADSEKKKKQKQRLKEDA